MIAAHPELKKITGSRGTAALYRIDGHKGKIGFITPLSRPFCENCNRIRVTPDCKLRLCLGSGAEADLRGILAGNSDEAAAEMICEAVKGKPRSGFREGFVTGRGMGDIGG